MSSYSDLNSNLNLDNNDKPLFDTAKYTQTTLDWNVYAIFGGQWGDEGKGKIVHSILNKIKDDGVYCYNNSYKHDHDYKSNIMEKVLKCKNICIRFSGGDNAGHTMVLENGTKIDTHMIPSGCIIPNCLLVIGPMCVVNLDNLEKELSKLEKAGFNHVRDFLVVDPRCVVITEEDIELDKKRENDKGKDKIGTTCRGIGPAYEKMARRRGPFVGDEMFKEKIKSMGIILYKTHDMFDLMLDFRCKYNIVMEGAQSIFLDKIIGTPPYVTSGPCTPETIWTTGLPRNVKNMVWIVVMKSYATYVGGLNMRKDDNFKSYIETLDKIGEIGHEFGVTTGRKRQVLPFKTRQIKNVRNMFFGGSNEKLVVVINKSDILTKVKELGDIYTPFLVEDLHGDIIDCGNLNDMKEFISNMFGIHGIKTSNLRWSDTPHADSSILD